LNYAAKASRTSQPKSNGFQAWGWFASQLPKAKKAGITPAPSTPEELRKRYEHWMAIFGKIAKDAGLKPQ
jgi:hypothetical protein